MDAISFVLGIKARDLRGTKLKDLIYEVCICVYAFCFLFFVFFCFFVFLFFLLTTNMCWLGSLINLNANKRKFRDCLLLSNLLIASLG